MNLLAGQGLSLSNSWYFGYVYSRHGDKIAMCRGIPQPAVCGSDAAVMEEVICPVWCWLCDGYYCLPNHPGRGCFGTSLCCRHMPRSCPVVRVVALFLWKLGGGGREEGSEEQNGLSFGCRPSAAHRVMGQVRLVLLPNVFQVRMAWVGQGRADFCWHGCLRRWKPWQRQWGLQWALRVAAEGSCLLSGQLHHLNVKWGLPRSPCKWLQRHQLRTEPIWVISPWALVEP